jgi:hypothetical protein
MSAACSDRDRSRGRGGAGAGAAADGAADDARSPRYDLGSALRLDSMNGLPRLGHGFAESFVGSLLCGCRSCKGRCCMWAANGAEGRERRARLAGNQIGDAGVEVLARALPQMAQLTTLDLSGTTSAALCALIA